MSQAGLANRTLPVGSCKITLVAGPGIDITGSPVSCGGTATISAIPTPPAPNQYVSLIDDFFGNFYLIGQLDWTVIGANGMISTSTITNPGIYQVASTSSSGGVTGLLLQATSPFVTYALILGGGQLSVNWVINLVTLSVGGNRYVTSLGLSDGAYSSYALSNGVYFTYSDNVNAGKWVINCTSSSTTTSVNTSVAANTNFVNLGFIVNPAASSVTFYIDGVSVGTITTNIPTSTAINPIMTNTQVSGTIPNSLIDLFYLNQILTTPR